MGGAAARGIRCAGAGIETTPGNGTVGKQFTYFRAWEVLELHLFSCISTAEINC